MKNEKKTKVTLYWCKKCRNWIPEIEMGTRKGKLLVVCIYCGSKQVEAIEDDET